MVKELHSDFDCEQNEKDKVCRLKRLAELSVLRDEIEGPDAHHDRIDCDPYYNQHLDPIVVDESTRDLAVFANSAKVARKPEGLRRLQFPGVCPTRRGRFVAGESPSRIRREPVLALISEASGLWKADAGVMR